MIFFTIVLLRWIFLQRMVLPPPAQLALLPPPPPVAVPPPQQIPLQLALPVPAPEPQPVILPNQQQQLRRSNRVKKPVKRYGFE